MATATVAAMAAGTARATTDRTSDGRDPGRSAGIATGAAPGGGVQELRSQVTLNPLPLPFSGPGWAFTRPAESTMVISSSVNDEITPELTVAPDSVQVLKITNCSEKITFRLCINLSPRSLWVGRNQP